MDTNNRLRQPFLICITLVPLGVILFLAGPLVFRQQTDTLRSDPPVAEESVRASPIPGTVPTFVDVLANSGLTFRHHCLKWETSKRFEANPYDHGCGLCVGDVDKDGRDDILFLDSLGPNFLYLNRGHFRFEDVSERAAVSMPRAVKVGAAFGDYDNDGFPDLYVTSYRGGNCLFHNKGCGPDGHWLGFENLTEKAGVGYTGHSSGVTWFDYDNDGWLDLLVTNIGKFTKDTVSKEAEYVFEGLDLKPTLVTVMRNPDRPNRGERSILWRNNGDGTFTNVSEQVGLAADEWHSDASVADFDCDGWLDVYISNMFGRNRLYRNTGGKFEDVTEKALGRTSWGAMGCRFFDGNGDKYPDLYVVDMHSDMWARYDDPSALHPSVRYDTPFGARFEFSPLAKAVATRPSKRMVFGNTYFVNRGDGTFEERSQEANLENWWPWSIAVGDYNNDGLEDLYVAAGMGYPFFYWPNSLLVNAGNGTWRDRAKEAGVEPPPGGPLIKGEDIDGRPFARSSRAAAVADFDGDGNLDLIVNNFNHEPYLFRNTSPVGNYLGIRLQGAGAARDAVGARVHIVTPQRTWYRHAASSGGYLTQSSRVIHVGLGDMSTVDRVEIYWPGKTSPQVILSPKINQVILVVEQ